jgi:hypothetical protein
MSFTRVQNVAGAFVSPTAGPLPTDDVSHVVYLGEEATPLFPLAKHCELPSISADVVSAILSESIHICR